MSTRPRNLLTDLFEQAFVSEQASRGIDDPAPYLREAHDFVQFNALCEKGRQAGWEITDARWNRALVNYYHSEVGVRTIAHLCANFSAYYKNPLDRFGHSICKPGGYEVKSMHQVDGGWQIGFLRKLNDIWTAEPAKRDVLEALLDQICDEGLGEGEAVKRLNRIEGT